MRLGILGRFNRKWRRNISKRMISTQQGIELYLPTSMKSLPKTSHTATLSTSGVSSGSNFHSSSILTLGPMTRALPWIVESAISLVPASTTSSGFPIAPPRRSDRPAGGIRGVSMKYGHSTASGQH